MELGSLANELDRLLDVDAYAAVDPAMNGLQVGDSGANIEHVVGAVDAAIETIDKAGEVGGDLLLVHHGLFWGEQHRLTGLRFDRIDSLLDNNLALYAVHLPLDGHHTLGNAAVIADHLGLTDRQPFPTETTPIGLLGEVDIDVKNLIDTVASAIDRDVSFLRTLGPEPASVAKIAIVTGSGTDYIETAAEIGADVLITGEPKQAAFHAADDIGLPVILAGHYATETGGIRALLEHIGAQELETTFIDVPTGL